MAFEEPRIKSMVGIFCFSMVGKELHTEQAFPEHVLCAGLLLNLLFHIRSKDVPISLLIFHNFPNEMVMKQNSVLLFLL